MAFAAGVWGLRPEQKKTAIPQLTMPWDICQCGVCQSSPFPCKKPRATPAGGELYTFGSNVYGQLGLGGAWEWHRPIRAEYNWSQDVVEEVVCGGYHTFARSGAIVTFPKVWSAPGVTLLLGMIFF